MKISLHASRKRSASALVIVLVLLSVMAALVVGNMTNLRRLDVELKRLERQQTQRLQAKTPHPAPARAEAPSKSTE